MPVMQQRGEVIIVDEPAEAAALLDELMTLPGAFLKMEEDSDEGWPVIINPGDDGGSTLELDVSAEPRWFDALARGQQFVLLAARNGRVIKSATLAMTSCEQRRGRFICYCPCPETFEVVQRRSAFRASLGAGMQCAVTLSPPRLGSQLIGTLRDLSVSGALVALPLDVAGVLDPDHSRFRLMLHFPDGTLCGVDAVCRHFFMDFGRRLLRVGLAFGEISIEQERTLTHLVREIERETARRTGEGMEDFYTPSPLFVPAGKGESPLPTPRAASYPTAMAKRLAIQAEFVGSQMLALRLGGKVDAVQLSRQSDNLLALMQVDREGLLFALSCLHDYPPLVRHALGVAVRLTGLLRDRLPTRVELKAVLASALLHDHWRCLPVVDVDDQARQQALLEKLSHCSWLSPEISAAVVCGANRRPDAATAAVLPELSHLAALVDEVDSRCRGWGGTAAQPVDVVYRRLLTRESDQERALVRDYIRHFGVLPVGTLLRYPGDRLAWVQRLNERGLPAQVQRVDHAGPIQTAVLGEICRDQLLSALGNPVEVVAVEN